MLLYKQSNKTYTKTAFAEATANLIMRYMDGYKHDTKHTTKWQNQACSPLNITKCMTDYFEIRCERFASPHAHGLESPWLIRNMTTTK